MSVHPVCERIRSRTGEPRELLKLKFPRRLITLNGMKASEEITEEQSRQVCCFPPVVEYITHVEDNIL